MRKLHPLSPHETVVRHGRLRRPDGEEEEWSLSVLPAGRQVLRVELAGHELWHLMLDEAGAPERLEARLMTEGRSVEVTCTFFEDEVLLWNLVPTHPHERGNPRSNRRPTRAEIEAARPFLRRLARGRRVLPVGRLAQAELGGPYVRHPSHGGASEFRVALIQLLRV